MNYPHLERSTNQTRLLHLHPGQPEDEITCHLSVISLDSHDTEFEALSYVWGDSEEGQVVHVDGINVPITDNLWQALNGLRYVDKNRILWVDALCIKQSDNAERSEQVSHMNSIYTQATSVEIWLGEAYEHIEVAFKFITEFAQGVTTEGATASYGHLNRAVPEDYDYEQQNEDPRFPHAREAVTLIGAMMQFAKMPWFERTWTVQEFFLARRSTFHCGAYTLDGAIFLEFIYHLYRHNQYCCTVDLPDDWRIYIDNLFISTHGIRTLKILDMDFLDCLSSFRWKIATNPRDKIYGLLGLGVHGASDLVQADYTLPVEEIYETFVHSILSQTRKLNVLSHVRTEQPQNLALPSYVPDWSLDLRGLSGSEIATWSIRYSVLEIYDAACGMPVEFEASPGKLAIRGVIVDTLETTATHTLDSVHASGGQALAWNELLDSLLTMVGIPPPDEDPGLVRRAAFWLAMVAECQTHLRVLPVHLDETQTKLKFTEAYDRLSGVTTDLHQEYEEFLRKDKPNFTQEDMPNEYYVFDLSFANAHCGRKFAMTKAGRMGLVCKHAEQGDVVAVLTGGHVPYILRPKDGYYTLVGDAYIHGIMSGEAMPATEQLESIELH